MSASFFLSCSLGTCSYSNVRIKVFPLKTQDSSPIRRWHLSSKLHSNSLKCVQLLSTHCATKCHCILKEHQLRLSTKFKMEPLEKEYLITYHSPKCNADFSVTWTLSAMNLSDAIIYFQMLLYGNAFQQRCKDQIDPGSLLFTFSQLTNVRQTATSEIPEYAQLLTSGLTRMTGKYVHSLSISNYSNNLQKKVY